MPLNDDEFHTVALAETAFNDLLVTRLRDKGGASLRCRIELAAAILVGAIDHSRDAALKTGSMTPDAVMGQVFDLVARRAMRSGDKAVPETGFRLRGCSGPCCRAWPQCRSADRIGPW